MKATLLKFDFTPIALVAAMVVLLSAALPLHFAHAIDDGTYDYDDSSHKKTTTDYSAKTDGSVEDRIEKLFKAFDVSDINKKKYDDPKGTIDLLKERVQQLQDLIKKGGDHYKKDYKKDVVKDAVKYEKKSSDYERPWCAVAWNRSLKKGDRGADVKALQKFLNNKGFKVADKDEGSDGKETDYFGEGTKKALMKFQEKYRDSVLDPAGVKDGTGYFGDLSKQKLRKFCANHHDKEKPKDHKDYDKDMSDDHKDYDKHHDTDRTIPDFEVSVDGLTATVTFGLSDGCQGYRIRWGDTRSDSEAATKGDVCTDIYRTVELTHTYNRAGDYKLKLAVIGGDGSVAYASETVEVDDN